MELKNINTFVKVVEFNNFTKAAENMGYSQAAVTVQIKALESELGVPLFDRIGKGITLTSEGKKFLPYAIDLLKAEQEAVNSVRPMKELEGDLRICSASSYASEVLPELILEYKKQYPKVNVIVKVSDYPEDNMLKLSRGEIDFLLVLDENTSFAGFETVYKKKEPLVFVAGSSNPILKQKKITLDDIITSDFVVTDREVGYTNSLERELTRQGNELRPSLEIGSVNGIINMLITGYGTSIIPQYAAERYIQEGKLADITPQTLDLNIDFYTSFICSKDRWINPQMKAFIDILSI